MQLKLKTIINANCNFIKNGFNKELFLRLNPPFPPVKVLRFDGCQTKDKVILQLNFLFFTQRWESLVVEQGEDDDHFYFIDQGNELPFFLKEWQHRHLIEQLNPNQSVIIDDITFTSGSYLMDLLLYPILLLQFWYRKPIYQKVFAQ